jgi:hypothetical protein
MFVGGIAAFLNGTAKSATHVANVTNCTNNGAVLNGSTGSGNWTTYTGGIVGYYHVTGELKGCTNSGSVTNTTDALVTHCVYFRLGGIVGSAENEAITDCVNDGEVKDDSASNAGCVVGIVGCVAGKDITLTNCDNKKSVVANFNGTSGKNLWTCVAGVMGYSAVSTSMNGCDNTGNIVCERETTAYDIYMGGLVGRMGNNIAVTIEDAVVSGTLTNTARGGKAALGGLIGMCYNNTITGTHSTMAINNTYANQYIGGFIGQVEANKTTNISNCSVAADVVSSGAGYSGMFVGRLTDQTKDGKITTTLSNIWVKGSFEGTSLTAVNYTNHCYGTGSDYKVTDNIYFGDFK